MKKLTAKECEEIYYALETKWQAIAGGKYDMVPAEPGMPQDPTDADKIWKKPWIKELKAIIKKIGPDGRTLCASQ